jgi:translation elongation factor EF-1alpha
MPEKPVGKVEHYYPKVNAAAVKLTRKVKVGDQVHIVGHGDDFTEEVTSLQLDHRPIREGQPGQSVGLWVKDRVHEGDDVLLVEPDGPSMPLSAKPKAQARKAKPAAKASRPKASKAAKRAPAKAKKATTARKSPKRAPTKARKVSKGRKPGKRSTAKPGRKSAKKKR